MKKIFIMLTLLFVLASCADYDSDDKKNITIKNVSTTTKVIDNIKPSLLNVGINDFKNELAKNDSTIIDLRTTRELEESGIIPGAQQIDFYSRDFKDRLNNLDKNKKYLIYCRSGGRSSQTLGIMSELGFTNVYELRGGMLGWLNKGEKTTPYSDNMMKDSMNNETMMNTDDFKIITLNAVKWQFDKKVLTFKKGEKVKIKINNIDILHGIVVPDMRLQDNNEIIVDTSVKGTFPFGCLNYCGEGHKDMTGTIIIE